MLWNCAEILDTFSCLKRLFFFETGMLISPRIVKPGFSQSLKVNIASSSIDPKCEIARRCWALKWRLNGKWLSHGLSRASFAFNSEGQLSRKSRAQHKNNGCANHVCAYRFIARLERRRAKPRKNCCWRFYWHVRQLTWQLLLELEALLRHFLSDLHFMSLNGSMAGKFDGTTAKKAAVKALVAYFPK